MNNWEQSASRMDISEEVCDCLVKWMKTLDLNADFSRPEDLSDGWIIGQALVQIAPEVFAHLAGKIKDDANVNWRLKARNLKKLLECITEYYHDVLNLHMLDTARPDVMKLAEKNDFAELGKLLRLVLGIAINCEAKQKYITSIMDMEVVVQQNIMHAIQQLEELFEGRGRSSLNLLGLEPDVRMQKLVADVEVLSQKCHILEGQVTCLAEEKSGLTVENQRMLAKIQELEASFGSETAPSASNPEMRRRMEVLKEELFRAETVRDDYRLKIIEQGKEIQMLQERAAELQGVADKAAHLKDEVDALTETADKVTAMETALTSYKKRLEEYGDVKKQLKLLEDKNLEYYQANLAYEEDMKKQNVLKSQVEMYKGKVSQLHQDLEEEIRKSDRLSFENEKLESRVTALQREKERLLEERNALQEANEELRCKQGNKDGKEGSVVARELMPSELQQLVRHLEKENERLRASEEEVITKQQLLDDALRRADKLAEMNRAANLKLLELEAQLEGATAAPATTSNAAAALAAPKAKVEDLDAYKQKCTALQEALVNKENELRVVEEKYRKSIDKAKAIVQDLEPSANSQPRFPVEAKLAEEARKHPPMKELESKLLVSAFYELSSTRHREAVDDRLAALSAVQGHSFLSRQRLAVPRKTLHAYKSK